jgi:hypothetical protein
LAKTIEIKAKEPFFFKGTEIKDLSDHYPVLADFVF